MIDLIFGQNRETNSLIIKALLKVLLFIEKFFMSLT
jgi:hypothetical protein